MSDKLQSCVSCRNYFSPVPNNTVCRLAPPQPLVVGIQQVQQAGGLVMKNGPQTAQVPIIQGFYSPTAPDAWCAQWQPRDFAGERPPLPGQPDTVYKT